MGNLLLNSTGDAVGVLQQQLIEAGYSIDLDEATLKSFGPSTLAAVQAFQHAHVGPDGHRLGEDGIVGPFTEWALAHPGARSDLIGYTVPGWRRDDNAAPPEARAPLAAAIAEIGVHEDPDGSNRGPRVDVYTTPQLGIPWCAAFVSWAWARRDGGSPFGRIPAAQGISRWGTMTGRVVTEPLPGDIFVIPTSDEHGHCGLVTAVLDDGLFSSVEGNASNAVRGLVRPISSITTFVRPAA